MFGSLLLVLAVAACGDGQVGRVSTPPLAEPLRDMEALELIFEVIETVDLEENENVITVAPRVMLDTDGDFIVTDVREGQVRLYGKDGSLKHVIGRTGTGPGEFRMPSSARRTMDGRIVVPDILNARLTFFGDDTTTVASPIRLMFDAQDLGGGRFLLVGVGSVTDPKLLHIWNEETGRVDRSFLQRSTLPGATLHANVWAVVEENMIWAIQALSDTVYRFTTEGNAASGIPIPLPRPMHTFERGGGPRIIGGPGQVTDTVTAITDIWVDARNDLVVQIAHRTGLAAEADLVVMDRDGNPKAQLVAIPRLILVDGEDYYFADPDPLLVNRMLRARRR